MIFRRVGIFFLILFSFSFFVSGEDLEPRNTRKDTEVIGEDLEPQNTQNTQNTQKDTEDGIEKSTDYGDFEDFVDGIVKIEESAEDSEEKNEYVELPWSGLDRPEVEKFRQMYLSPKWGKLLADYLESAMPYRIYVRKCLQEKEMPDILEYLPVVESNYKTNAVSRSGAVGMWQFMANSVKPFLELNDYVDERLDPWKSTEAALKKLQDNYNYFGDWYLAIAAYNCGAGAMTKVLKKAEVKDFWYLVDHKLLPNQTALYVPKLLAITDLAVNSEYYGLELPKHDEEYEMLENEKNGNFDYITVEKAYSLTQLAREMRMDEKTMKTLNPSFIMDFTHPSKPSQIRLPLGMQQSALEALENLEPIDFPIKYKVVSGDSLWSISRKYHVTVSAICELNNIEENAILKIGKILYIPSK